MYYCIAYIFLYCLLLYNCNFKLIIDKYHIVKYYLENINYILQLLGRMFYNLRWEYIDHMLLYYRKRIQYHNLSIDY